MNRHLSAINLLQLKVERGGGGGFCGEEECSAGTQETDSEQGGHMPTDSRGLTWHLSA